MKSKFILILIIILAFGLRFWKLDSYPAFNADEAALGYNAYSILNTTRDEYGGFLPLNLKSFGDWKPAIYAYLAVPFVAIFGLNEWSIRLPSALLGVATVLILYFFILELFKSFVNCPL